MSSFSFTPPKMNTLEPSSKKSSSVPFFLGTSAAVCPNLREGPSSESGCSSSCLTSCHWMHSTSHANGMPSFTSLFGGHSDLPMRKQFSEKPSPSNPPTTEIRQMILSSLSFVTQTSPDAWAHFGIAFLTFCFFQTSVPLCFKKV